MLSANCQSQNSAIILMRGYFSFLLVFSAVFSLFYISSSLVETNNYNQANLIAIESLHQTEMGLKMAMLESGRQGAQEGIMLYIIELIVTEGKDATSFDMKKAKERIRDAVYARLLVLNGFIQQEYGASSISGISVSFWCSDINELNGDILLQNKQAMVADKKAEPCAVCTPVAMPACRDHIEPKDIDIDLNIQELEQSKITVDLSGFGLSLYSAKHGIAAVGYMPKDSKVKIG